MSSREFIEPRNGDKRYARRGEQGQFTGNPVNLAAVPLGAERRHRAKVVVPKSRGDHQKSKF